VSEKRTTARREAKGISESGGGGGEGSLETIKAIGRGRMGGGTLGDRRINE
jgi:hypothetical protein